MTEFVGEFKKTMTESQDRSLFQFDPKKNEARQGKNDLAAKAGFLGRNVTQHQRVTPGEAAGPPSHGDEDVVEIPKARPVPGRHQGPASDFRPSSSAASVHLPQTEANRKRDDFLPGEASAPMEPVRREVPRADLESGAIPLRPLEAESGRKLVPEPEAQASGHSGSKGWHASGENLSIEIQGIESPVLRKLIKELRES